MSKMIAITSKTEAFWINSKFVTMIKVDSMGKRRVLHISLDGIDYPIMMTIDDINDLSPSEEKAISQFRQMGVII